MEKVLLNICLVLFMVYFYKRNRHGLHILQLENYYNDRYAKWMWQNKNKICNVKNIVLFILPIVILFINFETLKILAIVLEIIV